MFSFLPLSSQSHAAAKICTCLLAAAQVAVFYPDGAPPPFSSPLSVCPIIRCTYEVTLRTTRKAFTRGLEAVGLAWLAKIAHELPAPPPPSVTLLELRSTSAGVEI